MFHRVNEADLVYEQINRDIVLMKLEPETRLSEIQLSEDYNTSRTIIRKVISRLADEGLVAIRPQSGTYVTPLSYEKATQIREIRVLLEPHAARKAAEQISESDLRYLDHMFERIDEEMPLDEKCLYVTDVDEMLHDIILDNCGNQEIADIIHRLRPVTRRMNLYNLTKTSRLGKVIPEMRRILAALHAHDGELAFSEMQRHLTVINTAAVDDCKK